jgi:hypothetical protein
MRLLFICCALLVLSSVSLFGGTVTLTLFPDSSAPPGGTFHWQFTLTNDTGFDLFPSGVQSTFPSFDGFAMDNPAVTPDLDSFNAFYPDGLGSGSTSVLLPLAYYRIAAGATPGATVGGDSCCTLTISYDLFLEGSYNSSDSTDSTFTSVVIANAGGLEVPPATDAPEPQSAAVSLLGLAGIAAISRIKTRRTCAKRMTQ